MAKGGKDLVLTAQCTKCTKWLYGKGRKGLSTDSTVHTVY